MRKMRLIQKSYEIGYEYEEALGGAGDVTHSDGSKLLLWSDEVEDEPDAAFFEDLGIQLPGDSNEEAGGEPNQPAIGDTDYSYLLQERFDGRWKLVTYLHARR